VNGLAVVQYGYIGLLAYMVVTGSRLVGTYFKAERPPKGSLLVISAYFALAVVGGLSGYLWAQKQLEVSQKQSAIAATI